MNSHQFFSSPAVTRINIYPTDLKQCLEEYIKIKPSSCFHPTSKFIKEFQKFYSEFNSAEPLSNDGLRWLASQLYTLKQNQSSSYTYRACKTLYTKMGVLVEYAHADPQIFNQVASCPQLVTYSASIKRKIPEASIDPIIINCPHALEFLVNCQYLTADMLNLDYLTKMKDYQYFPCVMNALERLKKSNKVFYPLQTVLNSQKNIDFILRHADHAGVIVDVLIKLYKGKIGGIYEKQAETYMVIMMDKDPEIFLEFSKIFLSNAKKSQAILQKLKHTLTESQFYTIIQKTIPVADQPPPYTAHRHR